MNRKLITGIAVTALFLFTSSFTLVSYRVIKAPEEFWRQLGITELEAKEHIKMCFLNESGFFRTLPARNSVAIGNRAAIVLEAMKYTRQYVSSADFEIEYQQYRETIKPKPYTAVAKTKENIREESIKRNETVIENLQKQLLLSTTDTFLRKTYRDHIVELKKEIDDFKKPNRGLIDNMWRLDQENANKLNERFKGLEKQWETNYPQNYWPVIKARLVQFLTQTNGIDYNAALAERNGKQIFTNPKYEAKSPQWKMAFRAGKEVTETARTFAQKWIKELK